MRRIDKNGRGVILYLRQEGRGIGLRNKLKSYRLQEQGLDTVQANEHLGFKPDERTYELAAQMLRELGVRKIDLLTNNPDKINQLKLDGIEIHQRLPLEIKPNVHDQKYLQTKKEKFHHLLNLEG
jgi:3,4-dihydroxy 2-butanone 4-phosphate synthase/GTP cyclohydrolase II